MLYEGRAINLDRVQPLATEVFAELRDGGQFGGGQDGQIGPQTNLLTAFVFGIIGTVAFAFFGRDMPVQHHSRGQA